MSRPNRFTPGDFLRVCDQTGFVVLASRTKKQWSGLIVREESWEARHPQDLVKGVADYQNVPDPRPRPHTQFVKIPVILTASGNLDNYGVPLLTQDGRYIYRYPGLGRDEVPIVRAEDFPNSMGG
jgi:hypothetical protein